MVWTEFYDMHSGGGAKEDFELCYIEAPYDEAISIFYSRFKHNPQRVTCTCCGRDYSIEEYDDIERATEYRRQSMSVDDFLKTGTKSDGVPFIIREDEIGERERNIDVPEEGYVWK